MAFTHIQGGATTVATVQTASLVLGSAPKQGNLVCVAFNINGAITNVSVVDGNSNSYTPSTQSPYIMAPNHVYLWYLLSAPANASATIKVSWTTAHSIGMFADEFNPGVGLTSLFDLDWIATGTGVTTVSSPTLIPTYANSLGYAFNAVGTTHPVAGATLGSWTGSAGAIQNGGMAEYDLSITGSQAVDFTVSSTAIVYQVIAGSFYTAPISILLPVGSAVGEDHQFFSGDIQ